MTREYKRFLVIATIILVLALAVSQLLFSTVFAANRFPGRLLSIGFFWLATCVFHFWVMRAVTVKSGFGSVFMMQIALKLLLYMAVIVMYLILYRQYSVPFTVHYMAGYLIFAAFEVTYILKFAKTNTVPATGQVKASSLL